MLYIWGHRCKPLLTRRGPIGDGGINEGLFLLVHAEQRTAFIHGGRCGDLPRRFLHF